MPCSCFTENWTTKVSFSLLNGFHMVERAYNLASSLVWRPGGREHRILQLIYTKSSQRDPALGLTNLWHFFYTPTVCQGLCWIVCTRYLFQASEQPYKLGIISTLQIRSLSHAEVKWPAWGHMANKELKWDFKPCLIFLSPIPHCLWSSRDSWLWFCSSAKQGPVSSEAPWVARIRLCHVQLLRWKEAQHCLLGEIITIAHIYSTLSLFIHMHYCS